MQFDETPEVKHSIWWLGNAISKLRIYAAVLPAGGDSAPIPIEDEASGVPAALAAQAQAEVDRLRSQTGGQPEILRRTEMNLEVAGELYLVGFGPYDVEVTDPDTNEQRVVTMPEDWDVKSIDEVDITDDGARVKSSANGEWRHLSDERDTIMRLWQRHPRFSDDADAAMRGVLGECEALLVLSNQVRAEAKSHQGAGILTMPNELSFGPVQPTDPEDEQDGEADLFAEALMGSLEDAIEGVGNAADVMPLVLRGPAEYLKPEYVRLITLARDSGDYLEKRIAARVDRLARGLNMPVEVVMGHAATTYANAEQIDEDTFDDYLEPRAVMVCDALTVAYLRPNLIDAGADPEVVDRIVIWYDKSALVKQVDPAAAANDGHDRGVISSQAWRREKGFDEGDAPTPMEQVFQSAISRAGIDSNTLRSILKANGVTIPDPVPEQLPDGAAAATVLVALANALDTAEHRAIDAVSKDPPSHETVALSSAAGRAPDNPGRRLMDIDRELRARLTVAASAAMTRALERAGNRLKGRQGGMTASNRDVVRRVNPVYVAATLGPALIAQAGVDDSTLIDSAAWNELEQQFRAWGAQSQSEALDVAASITGWDTAARKTLKLRQAESLDEGWAWMREALDGLAARRLYEPNPTEVLGEFDPTQKVPTGLVRQALAVAGGTPVALSSTGEDVWVGTGPVGGVGTGPLLMGALDDDGVGVEGYRWVYGPAFRKDPYEPHRALDGLVFSNFDEQSLVVPDEPPATPKRAAHGTPPPDTPGSPRRDGPTDAQLARAAEVQRITDKAVADGLTTTDLYQRPDGSWTPEREALHDSILDEMEADLFAGVPTDRRGVIMGGLPGAGKSSILRDPRTGVDTKDFVTLNPDDMKAALIRRKAMPNVAGLKPAEMAPLTHDESSYLTQRLSDRAEAKGHNLLWDITGNSTKSIESRMADLNADGYGVELVFVDVDIETAKTRALGRFAAQADTDEGGRYVSPEYIEQFRDDTWGSANRAAFEATKGTAVDWQLWDNRGDDPILVERQ